MKLIVFNFNNSKLDLKMEAFTLKAGYLLGDEVYTAGSTGYDMYAKKYLSDLPVSREISLLESRYQSDPETLEIILDIKRSMKASGKVKYKEPDFLAAQKKTERAVHNFWMIALDEYEAVMKSFGFAELKELSEEGVLGYYPVEAEPEITYPGKMRASDLLQRLLPDIQEDEEPEIFFLGPEFFSDDYARPEIFTAQDAPVTDVSNMYLNTCFTLPNISILSAAELQTVRRQLQEAGTAFRSNTDEWIDMCYFNDDVAGRAAFFNNEVLPAAATLQQSINSNDLLKFCSRMQKDAVKMNVRMGEIPVWQLWEYYKHYDVIKDETWSKLQNLKDGDSFNGQRWPVMMLGLPEELNYCRREDTPAVETARSRKYLLID